MVIWSKSLEACMETTVALVSLTAIRSRAPIPCHTLGIRSLPIVTVFCKLTYAYILGWAHHSPFALLGSQQEEKCKITTK